MKYVFFITSFIFYTFIGFSQNFIGEVRYAISSVSSHTDDTLAYFFDKEVVLIKFPQAAIAQGGAPYSIYLLSENKNFMLNAQKNSWDEIVIDPGKRIVTSTLDSVSVASFLKYPCTIYKIKKTLQSESLQVKDQETVWVSENLVFELPENSMFTDRVFANISGRIVLKSEIAGTTITDGYSSTHDSSIHAILIIPTLSKEYQAVLENFRKWRTK